MQPKELLIDLTAAECARNYKIVIGKGLLSNLNSVVDLSGYTSVAVIVDRNLIQPWLAYLKRSLPSSLTVIEMDPGEQQKDIAQVTSVLERLKAGRIDRKSLVINLGGGMCGDLGGFAASIYMRGIDFIQIPTTLLAQVDASVGGKVGVNFHGIKNMVGAFNQPRAVIVDIDTVRTLPLRELRSGFAEVLKHGFIADPKYLERMESLNLEALTDEMLVEIIYGSCRIKSETVQADEREGGVRKILNFGHTLGHAIETLSLETTHPLLHGEAIAIGMVGEGWISKEQGLISEDDLLRIEQILAKHGLPTRMPVAIDPQQIAMRMQHDKKTAGGAVYWTLLEGIGSAVYDRHVAPEQQQGAIRYVSQ